MAAVAKSLPVKSPAGKVKRILASSYFVTWPDLEKGDNKAILDKIRSEFPPLLIQRHHVGSKHSPNEEDEKSPNCEEDNKRKKENRSHICIGINEVTRNLEKGKLKLLLVCRSAKPAILTSHLVLLSANRVTPACALHGLSETLAPLLGIKSVMACGFKETETKTIFDNLVDFIIERSPKIVVPWLNIWNVQEHDNEFSNQMCSESRMEAENESPEKLHTEGMVTASLPLPSSSFLSKHACHKQLLGNTEGTHGAVEETHGAVEGAHGAVEETHGAVEGKHRDIKRLHRDMKGLRGDIFDDSETEKVSQEPKNSTKTDEKGTKRLKLQDVSVQYQKTNVKTMKCKEGKKKKRKKVKKKVIPPAPPKKMADSSDNDK